MNKNWTVWIPALVLAGIASHATAVVDTFDDGGVHNVDYSLWADGGTATDVFTVSNDTTVNLVPGSRGHMSVYDASVVNVVGGAIGGYDLESGYGGTTHNFRDDSVLNFYSGVLYRRYYSFTGNATLNILGDGGVDNQGGTGYLSQIQEFQLRDNATVVIHADPSFDLNDIVLTGSGGTFNATLEFDVLLPGGSEARTLSFRGYSTHATVDDRDGGGYEFNFDAINIGGPVQEGVINVVPEPGSLALLGLGGLMMLRRSPRRV